MSTSFSKKILKNSFWLLIDKLFRAGGNFILTALVARHFLPADVGLWNYATTLSMLFLPLALMGLDTLCIREIIKNPQQTSTITHLSFYMRLAGGLLAAVASLSIAYFQFGNDPVLLSYMLILGLGQIAAAFEVTDYYFQAQNNFRYPVMARNLIASLFLVAKLLSISMGASIRLVLWLSLFETLSAAMVLSCLYYLNSRQAIYRWLFDRELFKNLALNAWPLVFSGFSILAFMKVDQILIAHFLTLDQVGQYSIALKVAEMWMFIPAIILPAAYPKMIELHQHNEDQYYQYCQKIFSALWVLSVCISAFVSLFGNHLLTGVFGQAYAQAASPLRILAFSSIFTFSGALRAQLFVINNHPIYHLYSALIGLAVLVPLNWFFIPSYGITGAAWALTVSYAISAFLTSFIFRRLHYIGFMQLKSILFWKHLPIQPTDEQL